MTTIHYLAYGSNLCKARMRQRCPDARPVGRATVHDARLIFRGPADVVTEKGSSVVCGLWRISRADMSALDRFEGVSGGFYERRKALVKVDGKHVDALIYVMKATGIMPPSHTYYDVVRRGYHDFGIDEAQLDAAIRYSWENKLMCQATSARRQRQLSHGGAAARLYRPGEIVVSAQYQEKEVTTKKLSPRSQLMVKQRCQDCGDVEWVEKSEKRNLCDWCVDKRKSWNRRKV